MSLRSKYSRLQHLAHNVLRYPKDAAELHLRERANALAASLPAAGEEWQRAAEASSPLETYFDRLTDGPGIWKWRHYFEIYHRHFQRFIDRPVVVVEVGVYSGGSLGMWQGISALNVIYTASISNPRVVRMQSPTSRSILAIKPTARSGGIFDSRCRTSIFLWMMAAMSPNSRW